MVSFTFLPPFFREKVPATHQIGGRVDSRAGMNDENTKFLQCQESKPGNPARSQSIYRQSYRASLSRRIVKHFNIKPISVLKSIIYRARLESTKRQCRLDGSSLIIRHLTPTCNYVKAGVRLLYTHIYIYMLQQA
jgi:hypothetical protein